MCNFCIMPSASIPDGRPLTNSQRTAVARLVPAVYATNAVFRRDPTRTTRLRARYAKEMRDRFGIVRSLTRETVADNDALRLNAKAAKRFKFTNDPGRVAEFVEWLRSVIADEVLEVAGVDGRVPVDGWQKVYVREAYGRGLEAANALAKQSGIVVPTGAPGFDDIGELFRLPIHQDTIELLYTRQFEDLRGVTREMATQMSQVLADGLATGKNNYAITKALVGRVEKIGMVRGNTIVRTEIIRTHAEATLNRLEGLGIETVTPLVEFATAADPCPLCKELEGRSYTIAEARGIIPVHPNCRCVWLPLLRSALAVGNGRVFQLRRHARR